VTILSIPKIEFLQTPLVNYRIHSNSLSNEIGKMNLLEISSELKTREKHLHLLKGKKEKRLLNNFIIKRNKYFLRQFLKNDKKNAFFFFVNIQKYQLLTFNLLSSIKTSLFTFIILITNKGYKYLK